MTFSVLRSSTVATFLIFAATASAVIAAPAEDAPTGVNAQAADPAAKEDAAAACRGVQEDAERLACYDKVFAAPQAVPASPALLPEPPDAPEKPLSLMVDNRWELQPQDKRGQFRLLPYKPVFILGAFHATSTNDLPRTPNEETTVRTPLDLSNTEAKFQLSLKSKVWQNVIGNYSDLWFGYTQSSRWQVFNARASRPFRETDYEPELMMAFRTHYSLFGWQGRMATAGFNHQSNGRDKPLSRSWNRFTASTSLERGPWVVTLRPWVRIAEDPSDDDNPDIEDYMGRADLLISHTAGNHELSMMLRHSLRDGERSHGAAELNWAFPIRGRLRGFVQVFRGYGESLIDYNRSATYAGLGISLMEWYERPAAER